MIRTDWHFETKNTKNMKSVVIAVKRMDVNAFWGDVLCKNRGGLQHYFCKDSVIRWHCTNEQFSVEEYIRANCDYPGEWDGNIERVVEAGDTIILVGNVFSADRSLSLHVVSFIRQKGGKIFELDEYWADDGDAPAWRKEMDIGKAIR